MKSALLVYTHDLRLFYLIAHHFREEQLPWHGINSFEDLPQKNSVILTTQDDINRYQPMLPYYVKLLIVSPNEPVEGIMLKALQYTHGIQRFREVTVSIDPGTDRTGVAVFLDQHIIYSHEITVFHNFLDLIKLVFLTFHARNYTIKIGNGYRRLTKRFVGVIMSQKMPVENVNVYLIPEHGSSSFKTGSNPYRPLSRHENAAIAIGRRSGAIVEVQIEENSTISSESDIFV